MFIAIPRITIRQVYIRYKKNYGKSNSSDMEPSIRHSDYLFLHKYCSHSQNDLQYCNNSGSSFSEQQRHKAKQNERAHCNHYDFSVSTQLVPFIRSKILDSICKGFWNTCLLIIWPRCFILRSFKRNEMFLGR